MTATDVLSLARAKLFLRGSPSNVMDDTLLAAYVTSVSETIDAYCGPVIQRTVTGELVDGSPRGRRLSSVRLRYVPVASISSVVEYTMGSALTLTAESGSTAGGYLAERWQGSTVPGLLSGVLRRRAGFTDFGWAPGGGNVAVTYVAGRYPTTVAAEGTRFERAAGLLLKSMWKDQELNVTQAGEFDVPFQSYPRGIPNVVREVLAGEWQTVGVA